jgi:ABC-2 type transport system ATP-binding protein
MLSTHILAEAEQICDRVVIIDQGHIIAQDTPDKLRERLQIGVRVFVRAQGRIRVEELAAMLAKVKGVQSAEPFQDGVIVSSASDKEVRPALAAKILENGLELLELRPIAMTLEEIFLELTQQEKKEEKTA